MNNETYDPSELTTEQWLEEVMSVTNNDGHGMSMNELVEVTGRCEDWVRKRLRLIKKEGRLVVDWAYRDTIMNTQRRVPVYRILRKGAEVNGNGSKKNPRIRSRTDH